MLNFVRQTLLPSRPARLITQTLFKWQKDKCLEMGAALAYYALFSLLFLSLLSNIAIRVVIQVVIQLNDSISFLELDHLLIARALQMGTSVLTLSLAVLLLLRFLPSTRTPWKDIWPGALLTAALLLMLQQLVSNSVIEIGGQYQSYGVIGGVMILLLWIYFTCQIFFLGCEFSYIYAHLFGSRRHHPLEL